MDELLDRVADATTHDETPEGAALRGSSFDYLTGPGTDLAAKADAFHAWAGGRAPRPS
jgi:hypothetical protein